MEIKVSTLTIIRYINNHKEKNRSSR